MLARLRRFAPSSPVVLLAVAFVVALGAGLGITAVVLSQGGGSKKVQARVVDFGPTGDAVDPLGGLTLKLDGSVDRKRLESGLRITPSVQGTVNWTGSGFTFKPAWPGFAPGARYRVDLSDGKRQLTQWTFKTSGDLAVQFTNPGANDAEVDTQAVVIVQFNRPVAAVTALEQQTQNVLLFDPPVSGTGKWLTSATFRFQPATGFAPSTSYSVRVPHDLTGLPGGTLPQDYSFGFKTVLPAVGDEFPRDNTQFVDPAADVRVLFNQPVDRASAESAFRLTAAGNAIAGAVSWQDDQTLVFHPASPWPRGSALTATVAQGVKSQSGSASSAKPFSWSFTVAPNPAVQQTNPANGATNGSAFGINVTFNTAMDHDSTEAAVSIDPAPDKDNPPTMYWGQDTQLFINLSLQPSSPYRVTIGADAKDRYGQALGQLFSFSFTTAPRQPSLGILSGTFAAAQGTLDAGSPPVVSIATTNVSQVSLTLSSLSAADFRAVGGNGPQRDSFSPPASAVLRTWTLPLPNQKLNQTLVSQVDLNQGLPRGPLQPGFYLLDATGPSVRRARIALELTRTSVVVKRGVDSAFVWAVDIASGDPVSGAQVTLQDADGNQIGGGATGPDGTFGSDLPAPAPNSGTPPIFALVQRSGDAAMASDGWTGSATPFGFGFPVNVSAGTGFRGYVYTDRPIYRTGETVHVRVVLRSDNDGTYSLPQDTSNMSLDVQDSRGHAVASYPVQLDEFGSMGADVTIPAEGATGAYSLNLTRTIPAPPRPAGAPPPPSQPAGGTQPAPPNTVKQFIANGGFLVAEFRAPEFQVNVKTDKSAYTNGETLKADVQADLFFGSPLGGAGVAWTVNASPYVFHPDDPAYAGFSFADPDAVNAQRPAPKPVSNTTGTTDSSGHATFSVPAQLGDFPTSETFTVAATVTDSNQQQVSASASAIVHKAAVYAGAKPQRYVVSAGEAAAFDLVTLDTNAKSAANVPVKVEAFQRTWTTVKQRAPDGSEQYVSTPNDTPVDSRDLSTDGQGKGSYTFTPAKGGQYRVVVSGRDAAGNQFKAATSLYVSASDLLSWQVDNNDRIQLVADKTEYAPGETAHVLVPAPFAGTSALITVERGHVLSHDVRKFDTNSAVVDVRITDAMAPTAYLSVALIKPAPDATSVAAYRLGYVQLKVSPAAHQLSVTVKPDKSKLGPGDTVNVAVKTADSTGKGVPAEVSLAVVDQAILSLADDRNGTVFDSFYSTRALRIETGSTLGVSLNVANQAYATEASGGKGGSGGGDNGASQDIRLTFQNTAFWQANVKTDSSGNTTVAVKLPDNLTTWRINARGGTADTIVGEGGASIVTSRDLVVRPVAPRFFTAGDAAHLGAILNNQTDGPMDVTVSLAGEGLTVKGGSQKLKVPARGSATAYWDTTTGETGTAKITWQAKADGGQSDGAQLSLPIHDRATPETVASAGIVTTADVQEQVVVPNFARTDKGQIALQLDPSLSAVLKLASSYLETWPYEPADVTAARILDRVANWQAAVKLQRPQQEQSDDRDAAVSAVNRLIGTQAPGGGWAWWQGGQPSPQVTAQVLHALGVARLAGLTVDKSVLTQASKYLTDYLNQPTDALHPADPDVRAFMLLALAAAGTGDDKRAGALAQQRAQMGGSGKGALLEALLLDGVSKTDPTVRALADDLISSGITSATGTHWEDGGTSTTSGANSTRATSLAVSALLQLDAQQPLLDGATRWLAATRQDGHWRSPDETALAVDAIGSFVAAREVPVAGLTYAVAVNGKQAGSGDFQQTGLQGTAEVKVPLTGLPQDTQLPIDITKQGSGQLYYGLFMTYFTPAQGVSALSNGVTVTREYLPADGESPVTQVKNGDLVRVRLTVIAPSDLQRLRVEDYLPAGLEAVDGSLKITDQNLLQRQADEQRRLLQQPQQPGKVPTLTLRTDRDRRLINPFEHVEVRDDRVALFASTITKGVHEYVYYARATTAGTFSAPPVTATESQYPDVFGRGDSSTFTVTP